MSSSVLIEALNWCVCLTGLPTRTKMNRTGANTPKQVNGSKSTNNLPLKTKFGYHSVASLRDNLKKVINSTPLTSSLTLTVKYSLNTGKCIYLAQTLPKKVVPVLPRISYSWKVTRWPDPALALLGILGYQWATISVSLNCIVNWPYQARKHFLSPQLSQLKQALLIGRPCWGQEPLRISVMWSQQLKWESVKMAHWIMGTQWLWIRGAISLRKRVINQATSCVRWTWITWTRWGVTWIVWHTFVMEIWSENVAKIFKTKYKFCVIIDFQQQQLSTWWRRQV